MPPKRLRQFLWLLSTALLALVGCGKEALYPRGDDLRLVAATRPANGGPNAVDLVTRYVYDDEGRMSEVYESGTAYSGFNIVDDLAGQRSNLAITIYRWAGDRLLATDTYFYRGGQIPGGSLVDSTMATFVRRSRYYAFAGSLPDSLVEFVAGRVLLRRCGNSFDEAGRLERRACREVTANSPDGFPYTEVWAYDERGNVSQTYNLTDNSSLPTQSLLYGYHPTVRNPLTFTGLPNYHSVQSPNVQVLFDGRTLQGTLVSRDDVLLGKVLDSLVLETYLYE